MDPAAYVDAAAELLGLTIAPEHRPGVLRFLQLAESMARTLESVPLTPADEPGTVFTPVVPEGGA